MAAEAVRLETVEARPTAVVAQTTTWSEFPNLWPSLLDQVYEFVRPRPELGVTHDAVRNFSAANGRELAGPCWEIYGHAPPDPSEAETQVFWLLR